MVYIIQFIIIFTSLTFGPQLVLEYFDKCTKESKIKD